MNQKPFNEQMLDELLADSAVVADNGFSQRVQEQLVVANKSRRRVFVSAGIIWLAIALVFISPQSLVQFYDRFLSLVTQFGGFPLSASQIDFSWSVSSQPFLIVVILVMACFALISSKVYD